MTPDKVVAGSSRRHWWKCDKGPDHEWGATVSKRTSSKRGCPCCDGKKVSVTNSLASLHSKIAAQWHPTENGDLTPDRVVAGSSKKYWWKCDNNSKHEWSADTSSRTGPGKRGCPWCTLVPRSRIEILIAYEIDMLLPFELTEHKIKVGKKLFNLSGKFDIHFQHLDF